MDNNRSEILGQLASGQITAEQAAEQLRGAAAPQAPDAPAQAPQPPTPPAQPEQNTSLANRWLRIRVSDIATGRQRVSVNVPLTWVSYGLRIGARYSPEVAGLDANELMAMLQSGGNGQVVDVEDLDAGEHVQIFVE
jgi:hypothetical protein